MKLLALVLISSNVAVNAFAPQTSITCDAAISTKMSKNDHDFSDVLRPFGTLAVAASIAFSPISSSAQELISYQDRSFGSSSVQLSENIKVLDMGLPSYGEISNPKASQEKIKGVEPPKEAATSSSVIPTKKSGGSSLYPSKKAKPAKKERVYIEKSTEEKEADEKKYANDAKFVDMSMPSYGDSASGSKKSAFAL